MNNWNTASANITTSVGVGAHNFGSSIQAPPPVESPSRVRDEIGNAEQLLSSIHEAISSLDRRLDTVLKPEPPTAQGNSNPVQASPVCSHVTGRLNILNEGLVGAIGRLQGLAQRIEV